MRLCGAGHGGSGSGKAGNYSFRYQSSGIERSGAGGKASKRGKCRPGDLYLRLRSFFLRAESHAAGFRGISVKTDRAGKRQSGGRESGEQVPRDRGAEGRRGTASGAESLYGLYELGEKTGALCFVPQLSPVGEGTHGPELPDRSGELKASFGGEYRHFPDSGCGAGVFMEKPRRNGSGMGGQRGYCAVSFRRGRGGRPDILSSAAVGDKKRIRAGSSRGDLRNGSRAGRDRRRLPGSA